MSTYKAHIFKQRNVGEREEVKIKLFNSDGTPLLLGGGGGSDEAKLFFAGPSFEADFPDGPVSRIAFASASPSHSEGFDIPPEVIGFDGVMMLEVPPGPYLVRVIPDWNFSSAPSSGYVQANLVLVDSEGEDRGIYAPTAHQYNVGNTWDQPPSMQLMYVPEEGMRFELEAGQEGTGDTPDLTCRVEILKA